MPDQSQEQQGAPPTGQPDQQASAQVELDALKGKFVDLQHTANRDKIALTRIQEDQLTQQKSQEQTQLQQQYAGYSEDQIASAFATQQQRLDAIEARGRVLEQRLQTNDFRASHPNADSAALHAFLQTPEGATFVAYGQDGQVDMNASYVNAQNYQDAQSYRQAQKKSDDGAQTRANEEAQIKAHATISGSGGAPVMEPSYDLDNMTSDQMLEAGLVGMDPQDRIKPMDPKIRVKMPPR